MKVAVLDDWQEVAASSADWGPLQSRAEVVFFPDALGSENAAADALADFNILLTVQDRMPLPASLLARLPRLRMVGITKANRLLDMAACRERGIVVSHTQSTDANAAWAPAELTLGLLIAAFRAIPTADATIRAGGFQHGVPVGIGLAGKTLGIIGLGRLGSRVATYANAFGMRVIAWSPGLTEDKARAAGAHSVAKDALLEQADAVTLHVPLSDKSRGLLAAGDLARMKPGALLINTSRGPLVDEAALVAALRSGRISAALDVFDDEPLPQDHPLRCSKNTVLTPHLGYGVKETWAEFYPQSVENAVAFLDGKPIRVVEA